MLSFEEEMMLRPPPSFYLSDITGVYVAAQICLVQLWLLMLTGRINAISIGNRNLIMVKEGLVQPHALHIDLLQLLSKSS